MTNRMTSLLVVLGAAAAACDTNEEPAEMRPRAEPAAQRAEPEEPSMAPSPDRPGEKPEGVVEKVGGSEEADDARELANEAAATLKQMKSDPELRTLMKQASGIFIVPEYGRGAVGVGARGGEGVLVAREGGKWSDPVFYDIGGISVGAQFGGGGGEIAMLLMDEQALNSFKGDNTFSLNADAKLTLFDYSALSETSLGKNAGQVVFWSDTEGAFAGVALGATDISWDDEENPAFYGKRVSAEQVLSGKVTAQRVKALEQELSTL